MHGFITRIRQKWHDLSSGILILFKSLNPKFKKLTLFLGTLVVLGGLVLGAIARNHILVIRPLVGGEWKEGIVGTPRFINPVLATSTVDKDLVMLTHAGLMKKTDSGEIVTDLAESYTISENNLVYTFVLRDDIRFHNGKKVTADDVLYTIERIQDPAQKSPKIIEWKGISVEKVDDRTITFTLKQAFNDFLDIATIGIIPKDVFGKYQTDEFSLAKENIDTIGAGPYKISTIKKKNGIPNKIILERFKDGSRTPFIKKVSIVFYDNEKNAINGLTSGEIDHFGSISPKEAMELEKRGYTVTTASFPRLYGLFFNTQKSSIVNQKDIAMAIENSIDRNEFIQSILNGFGEKAYSPLPGILGSEFKTNENKIETKSILEKNGWKQDINGIYEKKVTLVEAQNKKSTTKVQKLSFTITTADSSELKEGAEKIKEMLEKNGFVITIEQFDNATLEEKIRTRDYEVLYYGISVARESQVYAFWHSSQKIHPGLNISEYTNSNVDKILETLQKENNGEKRQELWQKFTEYFQKDKPAIFIYSPSYIYIHREKPLHTVPFYIHFASDRFTNITDWYVETEKVLPFFN